MKIHSSALCLCAIASAAAVSSAAHAGYPYGTAAPITVPTDNVIVTAYFDHSAALYTGNLYFGGSGMADHIMTPAPNSDATNQGFLLFNNHTSPIDSFVVLPGVFNAGDVLHFVYDIIAPGDATTDVLRTDVAGDQNQFAWDPENAFFAIEDIYEADGSDLDFNDMVVHLQFTPIPAPGAMALLGVAGLLGARRRRS